MKHVCTIDLKTRTRARTYSSEEIRDLWEPFDEHRIVCSQSVHVWLDDYIGWYWEEQSSLLRTKLGTIHVSTCGSGPTLHSWHVSSLFKYSTLFVLPFVVISCNSWQQRLMLSQLHSSYVSHSLIQYAITPRNWNPHYTVRIPSIRSYG